MVLFVFLLSGMLAMPVLAAGKIKYHGSSTVVSIVTKASLPLEKKEGVAIDIQSKSSGVGIEKLLAGECDVAGVGRPLSDELRALGIVATPVFIDAYAVIANEKVPVDNLSAKDLGDLLTGKITSWANLAPGNNFIVKIVAPPTGSAHYKNFKGIFGIKSLPKGADVVQMTPYVMSRVKEHPRAIGWLSYSTIAHQLDKRNYPIKMIGIKKGIEVLTPNDSTVKSGEYPYVEEQYLYTRGEPAGNVKKLVDFLKGTEGRKLISDSGFFLVD